MQFGVPLIAAFGVAIIRGFVRPWYQQWLVEQVQNGRWTQMEAQRVDCRVSHAIWMSAAFVAGMGAWWWFVFMHHGIAT